MRGVTAAPRAAALIESMRDLGYSLETALADIVDNSIAANCSKIEILLEFDQDEPVIAILDNGLGMTEAELLDAMRPGTLGPLAEREESDLGRFGLGLKTASFSQCRKLTVVTRAGGCTSGAVWDLELVAANDDWTLQVLDAEECEGIRFADHLAETGTLVLW